MLVPSFRIDWNGGEVRRGSGERWFPASDENGACQVALTSKAWSAADMKAFHERRSGGGEVTVRDVIDRAARLKIWNNEMPADRVLWLPVSAFE